MKGSRGRAASPRRTHSGRVRAGSGCAERDLTRWAAEPARARLHPPVLPSLPAQPCASAGLPRDQHCRQRSASGQVRDAEVKGGIPAAGPWEGSSGQGQVTGASLQCRGKRGDHLTCKHQGATPLAASSPHRHPSKKLCGRWDSSGPTGYWGAATAGAAPGLEGCSVPNLASRGTLASGDWSGTQEQLSRGVCRRPGQSPSLQEQGHLQQQHSSPCHMWRQASHQIPNPTPPSLPIRVGQAP